MVDAPILSPSTYSQLSLAGEFRFASALRGMKLLLGGSVRF
jgi:hypothetical protein